MKAPTLIQRLRLWPADQPHRPVMANLSYAPADAFMLRLAFLRGRRETVVNHLPRQLVRTGLRVAAENRDARVAPHEDIAAYLIITVTPWRGYPFTVYAERRLVERFVFRSYALVPGGQEDAHIGAGVDAALAAIFGRQVTS